MNTKERDLVLIKIIKTGKRAEAEKAFTEIFNTHKPSLMIYFSQFIRDEEKLEAVILESFTKIYQIIDKFDENEASFNTWIFAITKNLFVDKLRMKKDNCVSMTDLTIHSDEGEEIKFQIKSTSPCPEMTAVIRERDKRLINAIEKTFSRKLSLKEVLEMRYFLGYSYDEISEKTDIPLSSVKTMLFRAKQMLKETCVRYDIVL